MKSIVEMCRVIKANVLAFDEALLTMVIVIPITYSILMRVRGDVMEWSVARIYFLIEFIAVFAIALVVNLYIETKSSKQEDTSE